MKWNIEKYLYFILIKESSDNKIEDFGLGFGFFFVWISFISFVIFIILNVNNEIIKNKKRNVIIVNNIVCIGI